MMLKKTLHNVFLGSLAFLVLFSTVSFTVERHFCGDVLIDSAIFNSVEKCASDTIEYALETDCCKDTVDIIKGQDQLSVKTFKDFDLNSFLLTPTDTYTSFNFLRVLPKLVVPHKNYSPPSLVPDIQVLDQVFII